MFKKGKKATLIKRFINPLFRFFRDYIIKLGFMDGYYGFVICKITMQGTYHKYAILKRLQEKG